MTAPEISYVDFDTLQLDDADVLSIKSEIEHRTTGLHIAHAVMRVHFSMHNHEGGRAKYSVHLFLDHDGHKHTSDKHHAWELREAIELAFSALETQLSKEVPQHKGKPTIRKVAD